MRYKTSERKGSKLVCTKTCSPIVLLESPWVPNPRPRAVTLELRIEESLQTHCAGIGTLAAFCWKWARFDSIRRSQRLCVEMRVFKWQQGQKNVTKQQKHRNTRGKRKACGVRRWKHTWEPKAIKHTTQNYDMLERTLGLKTMSGKEGQ